MRPGEYLAHRPNIHQQISCTKAAGLCTEKSSARTLWSVGAGAAVDMRLCLANTTGKRGVYKVA